MHATSGKAAASMSETPEATGRTCPAGTATFSAYPPPLSRAQTYTTHKWKSPHILLQDIYVHINPTRKTQS